MHVHAPTPTPRPGPPPPRVTQAGARIHLELDTCQAVALARVLAHYDALVNQGPVELLAQVQIEEVGIPALVACRDYSIETWNPVTVELLAAAARRRGLHPDPMTEARLLAGAPTGAHA